MQFVKSSHERSTFFSALSNIEREMTFHSEQGLYYSYYKDMLAAISKKRNFFEGFQHGYKLLTENDATEFPNIINVVKRFNVYPEIVLACAYKFYIYINEGFGYKERDLKQCNQWQLHDEQKTEIFSCTGLGDPLHFYVQSVFFLQGLLACALFLLCCTISNSIIGGLFGICVMFFNHSNFTRAMWTPPLRENISYPFFVLGLVAVIKSLKAAKVTLVHMVAIFSTSIIFSLSWQFAPFALFTQASSLFAVYLLGYIPARTLICILLSTLSGLVVVSFLMYGNKFLLSSLCVSNLLATLLVLRCDATNNPPLGFRNRLMRLLRQGLLCIILTFLIKNGLAYILQTTDDGHIFDILKTKFMRDYYNFHSKLYTCSAEFNFLSGEYWEYTTTLLLPSALIVLIGIIVKMFLEDQVSKIQKPTHTINSEMRTPQRTQDVLPAEQGVFSKDMDVLVYLLFQTLWTFLMAALVMRLKLFLTTQLIVTGSVLFCNEEFFSFFVRRLSFGPKTQASITTVRLGLIGLLIAGMSVQGIANINNSISNSRTAENPDLEYVLKAISGHSPSNASFASVMPICAAIKLSTGRRVTCHPHYEDTNIRNRMFELSKVYSRFSDEAVWQIMTNYRVDYLVLVRDWCVTIPTKNECSLLEMYDRALPDLKKQKNSFCSIWLNKTGPDKIASPYFGVDYASFKYMILRVIHQSVAQ